MFHPPSPDGDVVGLYNDALPAPSWYLEWEFTLYAVQAYVAPEARAEDGYTQELPCEADVDGATGVLLRNPAHYGVLDPMNPDTLLVSARADIDVELMPDYGEVPWLGVQWTVPADAVSEPPELFGQPFAGPDANGEYTLRVWAGVANLDGYFASHHPLVACPE